MTAPPRRTPDRRRLGRRAFLGAGGAALVWAATGCSGDDEAADGPSGSAASPTSPPGTTDAIADRALRPEDFEALGTCVLIPEMVAGPFPTIDQLRRRDITEGRPGRPLRLGLRVVDASCTPIADADVEVWHCDATGDYSSYEDGGSGKDEGEGTTFLRGTQATDADGIVELVTIVPGWYEGRAVHVHVRVHRAGQLVRTTQLFFPEAVLDEVLATGPYAELGPPDTSNEDDLLAGDIATDGTLLVVHPGAGPEPDLVALANLGIDEDG